MSEANGCIRESERIAPCFREHFVRLTGGAVIQFYERRADVKVRAGGSPA